MNQVLQLDLSRKLAPIYAKSFVTIFYLIILYSKILFNVMGVKFLGRKLNTPR